MNENELKDLLFKLKNTKEKLDLTVYDRAKLVREFTNLLTTINTIKIYADYAQFKKSELEALKLGKSTAPDNFYQVFKCISSLATTDF